MNEQVIEMIVGKLGVKRTQVEKTLELLEEGNTVPFIARYRKEMTGGLDEDQIRLVEEQYTYGQNLSKRKEDVARLIEQQGQLTPEIQKAIDEAEKLSQVDDIYRPYQQKRKTRATDAIAKGLEPLGKWLLSCPIQGSFEEEANGYLGDKVATIEEAMQGAKDIVAEKVSDDANVRSRLKGTIERYGSVESKKKKNAEDERHVYEMYYEFKERYTQLAPHRIMALDRAEKEKVLQVSITFDEQYFEEWVMRRFIRNKQTVVYAALVSAILDGLKRLVYPSVEREMRKELSEKAHEKSIDIFSLNLEKLLLQAPMKGKTVLGFDPAFRTGCKLAVIDPTGKMIMVSVIYPHQPNAKVQEATQKLVQIIKDYKVEVIAIGNGTASRESEAFVAKVLKEHALPAAYTIVSEAGASVYSASPLAKKEFPDLQVEQRSAISIARRILDPLAELIKIDPQSIGVGQYQHDLPNSRLKERLEFVVSKAVNRVGVNINTASNELLQNVAGLSSASATSIVAYREEHGSILKRSEIKKIPKIGAKTFEQAAGFLRVEQSSEWLDRTGVHPENYKQAKALMKELKIKDELIGTDEVRELLKDVNKQQLMETIGIDSYTLDDILSAISAPLRDYREQYDAPLLKSDVLELTDLAIGDELQGVVRNVVDFGAFVDIGLHEDGLVHISKMKRERVKHPSDVVSVGDIVKVWVLNIDEKKGRVQLSLLPIH